MVKGIFIALIRFYQKAVSPLKRPTCRFHPSCSEYFIEALKTRGVVTGTLLGVWRILRCNPFSRGGYDPVPEPRNREAGEEAERGRAADPAGRPHE